jgi:nucleotidyltransferase substrate binding protein (TIGR01987 family)
MSWKTMKKILFNEGIDASFPREVFRQAARHGLINNPEIWFSFLEKRNLSSHAYDEDEIDSIVDLFDEFYKEVCSFLKNIGVANDQY